MGYFFHQSTASHLSSQALKSARQMGDRARELALCVSWTTNPWVVRYMLISDLLLKHSLETGILEKLKPSQTWFLKRCCKKSGGFVSESLTFWSFQGNYAGGKHCSGACWRGRVVISLVTGRNMIGPSRKGCWSGKGAVFRELKGRMIGDHFKKTMKVVVVSNIFYFHPYLGKWSNLTNIFQMVWNHQPVIVQRSVYNSDGFHERCLLGL